MFKYYLSILLIPLLGKNVSASNDTMTLDMKNATTVLLQSNLELMAANYQIDMAEAEKLQAGLWPNPTFVWNADLYSLERNEYFNYKNQKLIQIEMMVPVTGRIRKARQLAETNVEFKKLEFEQFSRELVFEFKKLCIDSELKLYLLRNYEELLPLLDRSLESSKARNSMGMVPNSEVLRLEAELKSLRLNYSVLKLEFMDLQKQLRTLLSLKNQVIVRIILDEVITALPTLDVLFSEAKSRRSDLKMLKLEVQMSKQSLQLEKASALGDLKLGFQPHDKGSNYVRPYTGMVLEIPMPFFDRNQGNIQKMKYKISSTETLYTRKELEVRQEVANVYQKILLADVEFKRFDPKTNAALKSLLEKAGENYGAKLIDILEYLDIQRMYLQMQEAVIGFRTERLYLKSELEFLTNYTIN